VLVFLASPEGLVHWPEGWRMGNWPRTRKIVRTAIVD
jgi:hypothetical protein